MRLARPGQSPQHTAMAKSWLRDRRWEDEPPAWLIIDQDGHVVAIEQQQAKQPRGAEAIAERLIAEAIASGRSW